MRPAGKRLPRYGSGCPDILASAAHTRLARAHGARQGRGAPVERLSLHKQCRQSRACCARCALCIQQQEVCHAGSRNAFQAG